MESIFFRKDYDDPVVDKVKSVPGLRAGMGFALFSAVLLMISPALPFLGGSSELLYTSDNGVWLSLFSFGFQGFVVIAVGFLAFALNCYRKHGLAAICGGLMLAFWFGHFISRTLDTFFGFSDLSFGFNVNWWGGADSSRFVRMFGYWFFPIVAGMVVYSSLKLRKTSRKQSTEN